MGSVGRLGAAFGGSRRQELKLGAPLWGGVVDGAAAAGRVSAHPGQAGWPGGPRGWGCTTERRPQKD